MRDLKAGRPEFGGCAAGCVGATSGAFLGGVLAIGIVFTCAVVAQTTLAGGNDAIGLALFMTVLLILFGTIAGGDAGVAIARTVTDTPFPSDVEQVARAHFDPSTPLTASGDNPDERIQQHGNHAGQEPDDRSNTEQ